MVRLSAPSVRTISSRSFCQSRTARSARRRKSREARPRSSPASASSAWPEASERQDASARSAAASACSRISVSRPDSTATVTRSACCGLPLTALTSRSRTQPTWSPGTRAARRCRRTPASGRAPRRAAACRRPRPWRPRGRPRRTTPRRRRAAGHRGRDLLGRGVGDVVGATGQGAHGALEGLPDHGRPGVGVGGQRLEPAPDVGDGRGGQQPLVGDLALGDREQRGVLEAAAGEHPGQVGGHGLQRLVGGAVEHDRDRGGPVGGLAQEAPRHLVGVPGGGGDEEPQVGGGQQLGGQGAVALLHGVDVGGVEDGEPGGIVVGRDQLQRRGSLVGRVTRSRSGSSRSWPNQCASSGWCTSTGRARRRPQHARLGHPVPDEGVDQRRLAGAGGAADDGQQRRVEGHEPRQDVVLELVDHLRRATRAAPPPRGLQRQAGLLQRAAQADQRGRPSGWSRAPARPAPGGRHRVGTTCPGKARRGGRR